MLADSLFRLKDCASTEAGDCVDMLGAPKVMLDGMLELIGSSDGAVEDFGWKGDRPDAPPSMPSNGLLAEGIFGWKIFGTGFEIVLLPDPLPAPSGLFLDESILLGSRIVLKRAAVCDFGGDSGLRARLALSAMFVVPLRESSMSAFLLVFVFANGCKGPATLFEVVV